MKFKVGDKVTFRMITHSLDMINGTGIIIHLEYLSNSFGIIVLVESDTSNVLYRLYESEVRKLRKTIKDI